MRALVILLAVLLPSCATVFTGGKSPVAFASKPEGVEVWVDDTLVGRTPCQAVVWNGWGKGDLKFVSGDKTFEVEIPKTVCPWFFLNIPVPFLGIIGILGDAASGNMNWPEYNTLTIDFTNGEPYIIEVREAEKKRHEYHGI